MLELNVRFMKMNER